MTCISTNSFHQSGCNPGVREPLLLQFVPVANQRLVGYLYFCCLRERILCRDQQLGISKPGDYSLRQIGISSFRSELRQVFALTRVPPDVSVGGFGVDADQPLEDERAELLLGR